MSELDQFRQDKLERFLIAAARDDTKISSTRHGLLFIEAINTFQDPVALVDLLATSKSGFSALQKSIRQDLSLDFIQGPATQLMEKISDPKIANIDSGEVLSKLIQSLVEPAFFWNKCLQFLKERRLPTETTRSIAWLFSELFRVLPKNKSEGFLTDANDETVKETISTSECSNTRGFWYKAQHFLTVRFGGGNQADDGYGPGGRHDNDFRDIRDIKTLPTRDEILSDRPPFLRTAAEVHEGAKPEERVSLYIDNLYRMLREDMIYELREEINMLQNPSRQPRRARLFEPLYLQEIVCSDVKLFPRMWDPWRLSLQGTKPLPGLEKLAVKDRQQFLEEFGGYGSKILKNGSLVALFAGETLLGFGTIYRDTNKLSLDKPQICIGLDRGSVEAVLAKVVHTGAGLALSMMQVDTAVFAYEPFLLRLQRMSEIPLAEGILVLKDNERDDMSSAHTILRNRIADRGVGDLRNILRLRCPTLLDRSQHDALLAGVSKRVCAIQGPPGTGKSFTGALIIRALHAVISGTILVVCYTNHALDQFLEHLLDQKLPANSMVRLGSKASERTEPLTLKHQRSSSKLKRSDWMQVDESRLELASLESSLSAALKKLLSPISFADFLEYLEFLDGGDMNFFEAFQLEDDPDGMSRVGRRNKVVTPEMLLKNWMRGAGNSGLTGTQPSANSVIVWSLPKKAREAHISAWTKELKKQHLQELASRGRTYNEIHKSVQNIFKRQDTETLSTKRIIACTSTYAAKNFEVLSGISPEVMLLEEAGELLEAHVVTTLSKSTKQLIMIGDHKQLRPKTSNYKLTVEHGDGFDLNRSLFERLVLNGFPYVMLKKQHRMRPEISDLVRFLTYDDLEDAPSTQNRADIRGLQKNVVFIDHSEKETSRAEAREFQPGSSKQNLHEARLILKYVKYLAQQGYTSDDIVVLTPYLGQLRLLRDTLSKENDPVLNDMDNHDLFKAGLIGEADKVKNKRKVHLSTIDNYQGEEKNIVVASLTRSNSEGQVGFMAQPERLNVLLSRARDGLIIIGNFNTFMSSKKGGDVWKRLVDRVKQKGYFYRGLPVCCQSHPETKQIVMKEEEFAQLCPDGGCSQPCKELLSCSKHTCPSRCHILVDHSKMACNEIVTEQCSRGHTIRRRCSGKGPLVCGQCDFEDRELMKKNEELLKKQENEEKAKAEHDKRMEAIEDQIRGIHQKMASDKLTVQRAMVLEQRQKDLEVARVQLQSSRESPSNYRPGSSKAEISATAQIVKDETPRSPKIASSNTPRDTSSESENEQGKGKWSKPFSKARDRWEQQKLTENQSNSALDKLMGMVGLEEVKLHVLGVKEQVEMAKRQNRNLHERFHVAFLGNPGTGKTTVARQWGRLLYSLEVIPGEAFEDTTGSNLASGGVAAARACIDRLLKAGGGVFLIDEAYQLTSGSNPGGKTVLDFLLTEIEDRRDKIAFVVAGYKTPMETFFGHNPGIPSRIPLSFNFVDYDETELLTMLQKLFEDKYQSRAKISAGEDGLYMRIVVRRLARQRGKEGFGNMRDLENIFSRICCRQVERISERRRNGDTPDDFQFTKADLIGPKPSSAVTESEAWAKLQKLIGLKEVKDDIQALVDMLDTNYGRELEEKEPVEVSLNRVFLGNPGTGKTSVAKLYGRLLADIGFLSNGDVVSKTPSDFIGSVLGESEKNTSQILESSKGKVLIIDEAYMLDPGSGATSGTHKDPYREAVINTIVSQVHNVPGDDRCVLLLGYEEQMEAMYQRVNPGFPRRFPLDSGFRFLDFTDEELRSILKLKLEEQDLVATADAQMVACDLLSKAKMGANFGNAGEVENLISKAKIRRQKRSTPQNRGAFDLEPVDFDVEFDRSASSGDRLKELFQDTVGQENVIQRLSIIQNVAVNTKKKGLKVEDHVPTNFVFKGPPGTGKTTTARKIGQVYYNMGILGSSNVKEHSASDLIAEYVGQTSQKTYKLLESGLGKVLFIDEAYRLAEARNAFAAEAINELVDLLTKPKFKAKLIVILAGYEEDMDRLMETNPGLNSRFSETVMFKSLTARQCKDLLAREVGQCGLTCSALDGTDVSGAREVERIFDQLVRVRFWGNGRDVQNIGRKLMRLVLGQNSLPGETSLDIKSDEAIACLKDELSSRLKKQSQPFETAASLDSLPQPNPPLSNQHPPQPPSISTSNSTTTHKYSSDELESDDRGCTYDGRDDGVSDAIWNQLQADKVAEQERSKADAEYLQQLEDQLSREENTVKDSEEALREVEADGEGSESSDSEDDEANAAMREKLRQLEAARLKRAAKLDALEKEKRRQEEKRKKEVKAQARLREMGVCPAGFSWTKQGGGYRCGGGSHFVSAGELGL